MSTIILNTLHEHKQHKEYVVYSDGKGNSVTRVINTTMSNGEVKKYLPLEPQQKNFK